MLIIYLIVKIFDLVYRGVLGMAFNGSFESNMFLIEMIVFIILPIIMYAMPSVRNKLGGVLTASLLVVVGVVFNRMNVVFTGMAACHWRQLLPQHLGMADYHRHVERPGPVLLLRC